MMLRSFPSLLSPSLWTFWNLNSDTSASGINNSSTKNLAQALQNEEKHHHNIEDRIRELELCNRKLEFENYELNEIFLEIQTHDLFHSYLQVSFVELQALVRHLIHLS
jgi:hypothetical protein